MNATDQKYVSNGLLKLAVVGGAISYVNYRERVKKDFLRSEGHYRFSHVLENVTPWKQMYFTWFRMPDPEFNVYHRFHPYYVLGQIDYTKEVLIPKKNS